MLTKGYKAIRYSASGKWALAHKNDQDKHEWNEFAEDLLEDYMEGIVIESFCMNNNTARTLSRTKASTEDQNDGFEFSPIVEAS